MGIKNSLVTAARAAGFLVALGLTTAPAHALQRMAVTVGPDFPHILTGEIDLLYTPRWSIGINGGGFAYTLQVSGAATPVSMLAGNLRLRFHPFKGAFFFGAAGGLQKLAGSQSRTFTVTSSGQSVDVPATASATLNSPYLTTYLGWQFITRWGFTFGLELGYQLNFSSTSSVSISTSDPTLASVLPIVQASQSYIDTQDKVQAKIDQIGNLRLPYASVRIGWTF